MVVVIAITFIISWSPQYLVSIISQLQESSFLRESNFLFTMLVTHFCGFLNSCLNPIIYTAMSQKFRRSFKDIIRRLWFCCSCKPFGPYGFTYTTTQRFTSTVRHTLTETDPNHVAINENICLSDVMYRARGDKYNSKSSSSGTDSDRKDCCGPSERNFVKKYIFSNGGENVKPEDFENTCICAKRSPVIPLKGILKNGSKIKELHTAKCKDQVKNGNGHIILNNA